METSPHRWGNNMVFVYTYVCICNVGYSSPGRVEKHPRMYICIYIITIFCGIALFSLAAKRIFSCFLVHDTQHARRYITRYMWVSPHAGGACTGRRKAMDRAGKHFRTTNASVELQKNQTAGWGVFFCFLFTRANVHSPRCWTAHVYSSPTKQHCCAHTSNTRGQAVVIQQQYNKHLSRASPTANIKKKFRRRDINFKNVPFPRLFTGL